MKAINVSKRSVTNKGVWAVNLDFWSSTYAVERHAVDAFQQRPRLSLLPVAIMLTKHWLPLIDLTKKQSAVTIFNVQHAILRYGAFRLRAPELKRAFARCVQQNASLSSSFNLTFYLEADL